jgi:hypothetical protein
MKIPNKVYASKFTNDFECISYFKREYADDSKYLKLPLWLVCLIKDAVHAAKIEGSSERLEKIKEALGILK